MVYRCVPAGRQSGRRDVRTNDTLPECLEQPAGAPLMAYKFSEVTCLEHLLLQRQICNRALETNILAFHLFYPLRRWGSSSPYFLSPAIITLLRDPGLSARHSRRLALRHQPAIWRSTTTICSALNCLFGIRKALLPRSLSRILGPKNLG